MNRHPLFQPLTLLALLLLALQAGCLTPPAVMPALNSNFDKAFETFPSGTIGVEVEVQTGQNEFIRGVYVPGMTNGPLVLHLLPASGSVTSLFPNQAEVLRNYHDLGFASLMLDYRGVGRSDGERTPRNIEADVQAMWREALRRTGGQADHIVVRAISLGSLGFAHLLEAEAPPKAAILIIPVRAETAVRRYAHSVHGLFVGWLAGMVYRPITDVDLLEQIARFQNPLLVLTADQDEFLTDSEQSRLMKAVIKSGGHYVRIDGSHVSVGALSNSIMAHELPFVLPLRKASTDTEERMAHVLRSLPESARALFPPESTARSNLLHTLEISRLNPPLPVAAAALNSRNELEAYYLLRLSRHVVTDKWSFDDWNLFMSMDDPDGRLEVDRLSAMGRMMRSAVRPENPKEWSLRPENLERSARKLKFGDRTDIYVLKLRPGGSVRIHANMRFDALWQALEEKGLSLPSARRQYVRYLLKCQGLLDRVREDNQGRAILEVREGNTWKALDLPTEESEESPP